MAAVASTSLILPSIAACPRHPNRSRVGRNQSPGTTCDRLEEHHPLSTARVVKSRDARSGRKLGIDNVRCAEALFFHCVELVQKCWVFAAKGRSRRVRPPCPTAWLPPLSGLTFRPYEKRSRL